jgi:YggT family protein
MQGAGMGALIDFSCFIIGAILTAILWMIFAYVIATWLVQFNVVNMRNQVMRSIVYFLERFAEAILRPIRRFVPPIGGLDLSPFLVSVVIIGITNILLPDLQLSLHRAIGD